MNDYVQVNLDDLTKAVSEIDGGCSDCILSFLNTMEQDLSELIVKKLNDGEMVYSTITFDTFDKKWDTDE